MAVIQKCTFCGSALPQGAAKLYVRKDAKLIWLCSNKCEKNMHKLGRKPRETPWTEEYKIEKKSRMAAQQHQHSQEAEEAKPAKKAAKKTGSKK